MRIDTCTAATVLPVLIDIGGLERLLSVRYRDVHKLQRYPYLPTYLPTYIYIYDALADVLHYHIAVTHTHTR